MGLFSSSSSSKKNSADIAFYADSKAAYSTFSEIIYSLIHDFNKTVAYYTSVADDPTLKKSNPNLTSQLIDGGSAFSTLAGIEAKLLVMSSLGSDKRPIIHPENVRNLVYIPTSFESYSFNHSLKALEGYDTVFCATQHHVKEIREIENINGTKHKKLMQGGLPLFDEYIRKFQSSSQPADNKPSVTIAPSNKPNNLFDNALAEIIDIILGEGLVVRLRPGKNSGTKKSAIDSLVAKYKGYEEFILDTTPAIAASLVASHVMLTDWDEIGYIFALATLKPAIFITTPAEAVNAAQADLVKAHAIEINWRKKLGKEFTLENFKDSLGKSSKTFAMNPSLLQRELSNFRENNIFNVQKSLNIYAQAISLMITEASQ